MLVLLLCGTPVSRFLFFQGTTGRVTFYTFHSSVTQHARKKAVMIIPSKKHAWIWPWVQRVFILLLKGIHICLGGVFLESSKASLHVLTWLYKYSIMVWQNCVELRDVQWKSKWGFWLHLLWYRVLLFVLWFHMDKLVNYKNTLYSGTHLFASCVL